MLVGAGSLGTKFSADRNIRLADVAFLHTHQDLSHLYRLASFLHVAVCGSHLLFVVTVFVQQKVATLWDYATPVGSCFAYNEACL